MTDRGLLAHALSKIPARLPKSRFGDLLYSVAAETHQDDGSRTRSVPGPLVPTDPFGQLLKSEGIENDVVVRKTKGR